MTTKKIYGPWIKWHGGERPVPRDTVVKVKLRCGVLGREKRAARYCWNHNHNDNAYDIVEYRTFTEQPDLDAAEQLLRANGYTVTPPTKPITFEDVVPLTEAPPKGTRYWVVSTGDRDGVYGVPFDNGPLDHLIIKRRMAYLDKEDALVAARHIFGLKGGEL